jgi:hypothetical protein
VRLSSRASSSSITSSSLSSSSSNQSLSRLARAILPFSREISRIGTSRLRLHKACTGPWLLTPWQVCDAHRMAKRTTFWLFTADSETRAQPKRKCCEIARLPHLKIRRHQTPVRQACAQLDTANESTRKTSV